jgi:hypothetical protein
MPEINGKQVTFRSRFPARDNWDLPQKLAAISEQTQKGGLDLKMVVPVLQRMIESWEFDGDPAKADAYGDLDIFSELIPMLGAAAKTIGELTGRGEAVSGRTSP